MTAIAAAKAAAPRRYAVPINIPPSYASTSNADLFTGTSLPSSIFVSILSLWPPSRHCKLCCTRQRTALIYQRIPLPPLALEEAADNAPKHRAPERLTGLAADALADGCADLVTGATRHFTSDLLAGGKPLPRAGAENPITCRLRCPPSWSPVFALNAILSTPSCASLKFIRRDSSSGPISETVDRIGCPCSPNRSQ